MKRSIIELFIRLYFPLLFALIERQCEHPCTRRRRFVPRAKQPVVASLPASETFRAGERLKGKSGERDEHTRYTDFADMSRARLTFAVALLYALYIYIIYTHVHRRGTPKNCLALAVFMARASLDTKLSGQSVLSIAKRGHFSRSCNA